MNKFFFKVFDNYKDGLILIYSYRRGVSYKDSVPYKDIFVLYDKHQDIFLSMCKEPAKAIMYVNHVDNAVCRMAKVIIFCKSPVRVVYEVYE